jgi:hypothetical protein
MIAICTCSRFPSCKVLALLGLLYTTTNQSFAAAASFEVGLDKIVIAIIDFCRERLAVSDLNEKEKIRSSAKSIVKNLMILSAVKEEHANDLASSSRKEDIKIDSLFGEYEVDKMNDLIEQIEKEIDRLDPDWVIKNTLISKEIAAIPNRKRRLINSEENINCDEESGCEIDANSYGRYIINEEFKNKMSDLAKQYEAEARQLTDLAVRLAGVISDEDVVAPVKNR